jgi:hypothetical protein
MQPGEPPPVPREFRLVIRAWNLMGGEIDWAAIPILCPMFGITDVELFVVQLTTLRNHMQENKG